MAPTLLDEKIFEIYAIAQLVMVSYVSYFVSTWIVDFIKLILSRIPYIVYNIFDFWGSHFLDN